MMRLVPIHYDLKKYVEIAYKDDNDLLTKYHIDNYNFEQAVDVTMQMISLTSKDVKMSFFGVVNNNENIGYLCVFSNNLYSFGINIKKRTKEVLSEFWSSIKEVLGNSFICMLFKNNIRAIKYLQKCGMVIIEGVEEEAVTLLYHN